MSMPLRITNYVLRVIHHSPGCLSTKQYVFRQRRKWMNRFVKFALPATALAVFAPAVLAQGPPGGGGPGGFQMTPEMQARMKTMQKFRENHKHLSTLGDTLRSLPRLEEDPKTSFNKDQSKKLLA